MTRFLYTLGHSGCLQTVRAVLCIRVVTHKSDEHFENNAFAASTEGHVGFRDP